MTRLFCDVAECLYCDGGTCRRKQVTMTRTNGCRAFTILDPTDKEEYLKMVHEELKFDEVIIQEKEKTEDEVQDIPEPGNSDRQAL